MVTGTSKGPIRSGSPFQSWVTFRTPVAVATPIIATPRSAIRRMPGLCGTSASRERCHHEGPWYSSSIEGSPCARSSRIHSSEEFVRYVDGRARVKLASPCDRRFDKSQAPPYLRLGMTTTETVDAVVKVLSPYIGATMARSATEAHCQKLGIAAASPMRPDQLETLLGKLGGGLNIFLGREKSAAAIGEIRQALTALGGTR